MTDEQIKQVELELASNHASRSATKTSEAARFNHFLMDGALTVMVLTPVFGALLSK